MLPELFTVMVPVPAGVWAKMPEAVVPVTAPAFVTDPVLKLIPLFVPVTVAPWTTVVLRLVWFVLP